MEQPPSSDPDPDPVLRGSLADGETQMSTQAQGSEEGPQQRQTLTAPRLLSSYCMPGTGHCVTEVLKNESYLLRLLRRGGTGGSERLKQLADKHRIKWHLKDSTRPVCLLTLSRVGCLEPLPL